MLWGPCRLAWHRHRTLLQTLKAGITWIRVQTLLLAQEAHDLVLADYFYCGLNPLHRNCRYPIKW